MSENILSEVEIKDLLKILEDRFIENTNFHKDIKWSDVSDKLKSNTKKLNSLNQMEATGGEPDVVGYDIDKNEYIFYDTAKESPSKRRSLCYDKEALNTRKKNKPKNNVLDVCDEMGIELLSEEDYRYLGTLGEFDTKTSSWIKTPSDIRELGGALFGDYRYGTIFVYHNGADSYYSSRGFRGCLRV